MRLDRKTPLYESNDEIKEDNSSANSPRKKKANGWNWKGTFEHNEGVLKIKESWLNDFEFRRNLEWKQDAMKFTCRTWNIHMVISTPD